MQHAWNPTGNRFQSFCQILSQLGKFTRHSDLPHKAIKLFRYLADYLENTIETRKQLLEDFFSECADCFAAFNKNRSK